MPKLVPKKIMKIITDHVFLNGKIFQIHCKNNCLKGLSGCVRERNRYQTNIQLDTKIQYEFNDKSMYMLGKVMQTT